MTSAKDGRNSPITYAQAGVDIDAGNALVDAIKPLAKATRRPGAGADLGGFGALFDLKAAGFVDPILVSTTDGVGTKLRIAVETGLHATIGQDLVAMCVNDLLAQGAEPLLFLDYFACGKLNVEAARIIIAGIAEGCKIAGCALIGGETAEMPGHYQGEDYDLAGFAVGAVERGEALPRADIEPGDVILGLPSSGPHSNGYSLIRKLVEVSGAKYDQPAPFEPAVSLGEALMRPTHIYVKPVLEVLRDTGALKALAHITGGGLSENIPRVLPASLTAEVDLSSWVCPPVFGWLAREGRLDTHEMARTFNCGIGMIAVVAPSEAARVTAQFQSAGEQVLTIGHIVLAEPGIAGAVGRSGKGGTPSRLIGDFQFGA